MTDLPSLSALSDDELIEKCAVEIMGQEWIEANTISGDLRPDCECDCECGYESCDWNPISNWSHTMQVVEKMRELGKRYLFAEHAARIVLTNWPGNVNASHFYDGVATGLCDMNQRAIVLAALLAVSHD